MQVVGVEVKEVELGRPAEHLLHHAHVVRQGIDAVLVRAERAGNHRHQAGRRLRVSAGEERDLVSLAHQRFHQPVHHALGASIAVGRDALVQGGDDSDAHGVLRGFVPSH